MPDPRNVAGEPSFRPGDDRAGGEWTLERIKPDRCSFRLADYDGYYACDRPKAHPVHDNGQLTEGAELMHGFTIRGWVQCDFPLPMNSSTYYCVRTKGHRNDHLYDNDPDETPERLAAAIIKLGEEGTPETAEVMANLWNAANKAEVYRSALEAIHAASRPELKQPSNWMKIVYEVSGAALSDPPRLVDPMSFTQDFTDRSGPSEAELSGAMAEVFAHEAQDARDTGIRPTGGAELRAWNYIIDHFERFAGSPRTARAVLKELRAHRPRPWKGYFSPDDDIDGGHSER